MALFYLFDHCFELFFFTFIDYVRKVLSDHGFMCGNYDHFQFVDLPEFRFFGLGGAGHAGQFMVKPEIVLESDGRQGLRLFPDPDPFFGFNGLMQAVAVAPPHHQTPRKFIHNDDLSIFYDIIDIPAEKMMGFQRLDDLVRQLHVLNIKEIFDTQQFFDLFYAGLLEDSILGLLVHLKIRLFDQALYEVISFIICINFFFYHP